MPTTRRSIRRRDSPVRLVASISAATIAHGVLALLMWGTGWPDLRALARPATGEHVVAAGEAADAPSPIELRDDEVERSADEIVESLRRPAVPTPEEAKREEEEKKREEEKDPKGQIVDIERPAI